LLQTLGEYGPIVKHVPADDIEQCLTRRYVRCVEERTKLWILSAIRKLLPYFSNQLEVLNSLPQNADDDGQEVLQVRLCSLFKLVVLPQYA
jgi:hypothetical protein